METLFLFSMTGLKVEHLRLLASVQWPSLTSLQYWSNGAHSPIVSRLVKHAPKLKKFLVHICSGRGNFASLAKIFGQSEWPNLQEVCFENVQMGGASSKQVPAMQKACPNAVIDLFVWNGEDYDSKHFYGLNVSPKCGEACSECLVE
jgi:hypothetical protein